MSIHRVAICLVGLLATSAAIAEEPTTQAADHWAFRKFSRPATPQIDQCNTPIDAFIKARLKTLNLNVSPKATKHVLIRRAYFDLTGLPPTPADVDRFLRDEAPDAFERLINRLLASPHYGEHWGRKWLDLVRYAETAGFNADPARPLAYKYREYVVKAMNDSTPYDQFIAQQIAGDELFPDQPHALAATGFNLMWPDESNASNVLLARQDALNDLTTNVGAVFLGVSIGCAQCHDHKFDPILQTDFYRLQSFFVGIVPQNRVPIGTSDQLNQYEASLAAWREEVASVYEELHTLEQTARAKASTIKRLKFPEVVLKAIDTPASKRTAFQHQLAFWSDRQIVVSEKQLVEKLSKDELARRTELKKHFEELKKKRPQPPQWVSVMASVELKTGAPPTFLLEGGSYDNPSDELKPGFLSAIIGDDSAPAQIEQPRPGTTGRRSALVRWMTSNDNPLTSRVIANRLWQGHFGRGLVSNANDFGQQTEPPTHPDLLDWLASELIARNWDLKSMHRLIMTSDTYQQSALFSSSIRAPESHKVQTQLASTAETADPGNQLYWHYPRRRLNAESIRDSMLQVSGRLNKHMHGPSVRPALPPNFSSRESWTMTKSVAQQDRRSVYIYAKRNLPYPLLNVFDFPDMHESCAKRAQTTVAPQALMLLNSNMILGFAKSFAERVRQLASDDIGQIQMAYRLAFGRAPIEPELVAAQIFLTQQRSVIADNLKANKSGAGPGKAATEQAVVDLCHALLNSNEFLYLD